MLIVSFLCLIDEQHDDTLIQTKQRQPEAMLSDTNSFQQPLTERPAIEQRHEIIRTRQYKVGKNIGPQDDVNNFNALCRGENLLSLKVQSKLKCWLDNRKQSYLILMPIKVEQHSLEPAIYTFHDVLSDVEIAAIKLLAKPLVRRNKIVVTVELLHFLKF